MSETQLSTVSSSSLESAFRVAALQMVSTPDRERNLAEAGRLIAEAARDGAQLVLLPEYFCFMGFKDTDKLAIRETPRRRPDPALSGRRGARASGLGDRRHAAAAVARSRRACSTPRWCSTRTADRSRATTRSICSTSKRARNRSTKRAPSAPAAKCARFEAPFGRVGLSVCYDLRFPELYRRDGRLRADRGAVGVHLHDRPRALGNAAARRARSKTSATCWPRRKAASTRTAAAPGATAC